MKASCGSETLRAQLQIPDTDSLLPHEIANMINVEFLELMQTYQSIDPPLPSKLINSKPVPCLDWSCFICAAEFTSIYLTKHVVLMASQAGFLKNVL